MFVYFFSFIQATICNIFETSKSNLQQNLESTPVNKLSNKINNNERSSKSTVNRQQQTITPIIDPTLVATIHCNKGAIDTIRGQITELRCDIDQLRKDRITYRTKTHSNNSHSRRSSEATMNNHNQTSVRHRHHHHHRSQIQDSVTRRSSLCILL